MIDMYFRFLELAVTLLLLSHQVDLDDIFDGNVEGKLMATEIVLGMLLEIMLDYLKL